MHIETRRWILRSQAIVLALLCVRAVSANHQKNPVAIAHAEHAMGFSQNATMHHFLLRKDGGTIQVEVKDPNDTVTRDHIRVHLQHITKSFANGDFNDPMEVHDRVPPGVPTMVELKDKISFRFESIEKGGRVLVRTNDADALAAIHKFLQFQIREHHTGDPERAP
jgi:hypothetical protein